MNSAFRNPKPATRPEPKRRIFAVIFHSQFLSTLAALLLIVPAGFAQFQPPPVPLQLQVQPQPLQVQPQTRPQPTPDPLMNLMLSQPQIDVDSPVIPAAGFDPPSVRPGEETTYWVKLNALEASIEWPEQITAPNLGLRPGGHGQILAFAMGKLQPHTTYNYHVRASQSGQYAVPSFTVQVYGKTVTIPAAQLNVSPSAPPVAGPSVLLIPAVTNAYVGQPIRLRLFLPSQPGGAIQALGQVQINGQGFIVDQSSVRQQLGVIPRRNGTPMSGYMYEVTLTPIATGTLSAFAQGFVVGNRFTGGIIIPNGPGAPTDFTLLDSDPITLYVRPLPREGEMPGFTGGFAPLMVDPPTLTTNVLSVGDVVKLTVRVHGDPNSNLARLVAPAPPQNRDWQVFAAPDAANPLLPQAQGFVTFSYTMIPLTPRATATPEIPFSCFDPERGNYENLTIPSIPVEVTPGTLPADFRVVQRANASDTLKETEPTLSGLASTPGLASASLVPLQRQYWFFLVQLVPAASFLSLWGWDRRRRFLEQHPGIVLRRRARRALHRHVRALRAAARCGDSSRFALAAVSALQAGSAPHYPAKPQALVGADVLALLPAEQRAGGAGNVVRRIFAASDAARFGPAGANGSELLDLKPELEQVIAQFEQQLQTPRAVADIFHVK